MRLPTKERTRDRVLSDNEIRWFWQSCHEIDWPFGPLFKFLLLTAQRRNEVGGMAWSEINLEKQVWTIPRHKTKSDRGHEVHLSDLAMDVLRQLPRITNGHAEAPLVFTVTGETPVSGFRARNGVSMPQCSVRAADCLDCQRTIESSERSLAFRQTNPSRSESRIGGCTTCAAQRQLAWLN